MNPYVLISSASQKKEIKIIQTKFITITMLLVLFFTQLQFTKATTFNAGNCRVFNGVNSEITFSNSNIGLNAKNAMTVTAWIKWGSKKLAGPWANMVSLNSNKNSGDIGQFWLQHSSDNSIFEFAIQNTSSKRSFVQSKTNPLADTWYHIAGVYDGSYISLYVNGVLEAKTAFTGNINNYQGDFELAIGKWANPSNNYRRFNGDIDEVSIWKIALTQTQLQSNMCKKLIGNEAGLIGYWNMNELSGTIVTDQTANKINGTSLTTTITYSGAPIGNTSSYTYGGNSLSLKDINYGDSLLVNGFSSTPAGIHIYKVDTMPNSYFLPLGYVDMSHFHYYGVFIVNANGETYNTSYSYKGHPGIVDASYLGLITRRTNAILKWDEAVSNINTTNSVLTTQAQAGRNEYILATKSNINPLPIELLQFDVSQFENKVQIKWSTSSETNNDFFMIERSVDGYTFEKIAQVKGSGNSSTINSYSTIDESPLSGTSYYRLSQVDYDGTTKRFDLTSIDFVPAFDTKNYLATNVYPNPFKEEFKIDLYSSSETLLKLQIVDITGKVVKEEAIWIISGNTTFTSSNYSGLADGNYLIRLTNTAGHMTSLQLVKKD